MMFSILFVSAIVLGRSILQVSTTKYTHIPVKYFEMGRNYVYKAVKIVKYRNKMVLFR